MTGRYPFRYGLQTAVIPSASKYGLSTDEWLLPQALKEVGYQTAIIGKWHLDTEIASTGRGSAGSTINTDQYSGRSTILLIRRTENGLVPRQPTRQGTRLRDSVARQRCSEAD
jgi:arylsulfatase A-like enzyme